MNTQFPAKYLISGTVINQFAEILYTLLDQNTTLFSCPNQPLKTTSTFYENYNDCLQCAWSSISSSLYLVGNLFLHYSWKGDLNCTSYFTDSRAGNIAAYQYYSLL